MKWQASFDLSRISHNEERPDEGLGMRVPAEVYGHSPRKLPETLPEHQYASGIEPRSVRHDGSLKWSGANVFVGEVLAGEIVGLAAVDDGLWQVRFGRLRVGILQERSRTIVPLEGGVTYVPGHGRS